MTPETPAVTLLICSSDHGEALLPCVESALSQRGVDVRLIVLDDGSSDGSVGRIAQIEDPRLVLAAQGRSGGGALLSRGAALVESDWVFFVPGASLLDASCVARALDLATAERGCDAVLARPSGGAPLRAGGLSGRPEGSEATVPGSEPESGRSAARPLGLAEQADLLGALLVADPLAGAAALVHRTALDAIGGVDPTLRFAWPLDLCVKLLLHRRVAMLPDGLVRPAGSRGGETPESIAAAAEASHVRMRALESIDPSARSEAGDPSAPSEAGDPRARSEAGDPRAPSEAGSDRATMAARFALELAVRALERGDPALRPFALGLARRALASGDAHTDAEALPAAIATRLPGLAPSIVPERAPRAARSLVDATPLRVALEVGCLDRGGLERVVADLALGLPGAGVDSAVVCTRSGGFEAERLARAGIEVRLLDAERPTDDLAEWLAWRRIDVLHSHFSSFGARVAAELGLPVVSTLHNAYAWVGAGFADEVRAVDPFVSCYTATSESVAGFCAERFRIDRARIQLIRNALPRDWRGAAPDRAEARKALGIAADAELAVQVARVDPVKCQLAVVEAVAALAALRPRLRTWLVGGEGDGAYAAIVRERIASAGLEGRVTLLGERDDVRLILAAADVFVLPSLIEGMSLAALEALDAGLPLILSRTGDAQLLLGEGAVDRLGGALVEAPRVDPFEIDGARLADLASADPPPHARAVADALVRVLDDLPARRAAARVRREELATLLSPERMVSEHAQLLRRIAALARRDRHRGLRAQRDALAAESEAARRATEAARRAALREARAVTLAAAAGRALRDAEWNIEHVGSELGVSRVALERGELAQVAALERLRLKRRAQQEIQRFRRWAASLRPGGGRGPPG